MTRTLAEPPIPAGQTPVGIAIARNGYAYVANLDSGTVTVIDTTTNTVLVPGIEVGYGPLGVAIAPNGNIYVSSLGGDSVAVIDGITHTAIAGIPVGGVSYGIAVAPNGLAYVANLDLGTVTVIDTTTNTVLVPGIEVGNGAYDVAVAPNGNVYVTGGYADVTVIDGTTNEVIAGIAVGSYPAGIAVAPNGLAYVANRDSGTVTVIDTTTNTVLVPSIPVGTGPEGVATDSTGRAYVANLESNSVTVIDTTTNAVTVPGIPIGSSPAYIAVAGNGSLYVTAFDIGSVVAVPPPGAPTALGATAGSGQSALVEGAFSTSLIATVTDANGVPVPGVAVTFTAPGEGGPSGTFGGLPSVEVVTGSSGEAIAPAFQADGIAGLYSVAASIPEGASIAFPLDNLSQLPTPPSISAASGSGQEAYAGTAFVSGLTVEVTASDGTPITDVPVTFTTPATGPSATFPGGVRTATVPTGTDGLAEAPALTADDAAGAYTVTATAIDATSAGFTLTNRYTQSVNLLATGGNGQSTEVTTTFLAPLTVTVTDDLGDPLQREVTFTAPAAGASGTFPGGLPSATEPTDPKGQATTPAFTANAVAGSYEVIASTPDGVLKNLVLTNTPSTRPVMKATGGDGQATGIGTLFLEYLVATVTDTYGNPISGEVVTFTAPDSGPSGTFPGGPSVEVATGADGRAVAPAFTANLIAGSYDVAADIPEVASTTFSLTNTPGPAATITATSGSGQSARAGTAFASPLVATVTDAQGNPVPDATVTFTAPGGGASGTFPGGATSVGVGTDETGQAAAPSFTANATAGAYTVTATAPGVAAPADFTLTNLPGTPGAVTATFGSGQSTRAGTAFASPLIATLTDAQGVPVPDATITFTAPAEGPSGTFPGGVLSVQATTNAAGQATAPRFTANTIAGSYDVTASTPGARSAAFALTNLPSAPGTVIAASGSRQSIRIGTTFASPLVAGVIDAQGNPVPDATVTFTAPAEGPSGTFPGGVLSVQATTNAAGQATAPSFTANDVSGTYDVTASTPGATPAAFTLTNLAGPPVRTIPTSGTDQVGKAGEPFPQPMVATVEDAYGNPVPDVEVVFTSPDSGPSGTFPNGTTAVTVRTDTKGRATAPPFKANTIPGTYKVTASAASGLQPLAADLTTVATFTLTNAPSTASTIIAASGSGQSTPVGTPFLGRLVATVADVFGNPIPDAPVTFTAPAGGPSGAFPGGALSVQVSTNPSGQAVSPAFTANATAGAYTVAATTPGVAAPATFTLTNTATSTIILTSTANPSTPGQQVTFTATVGCSAGTPAGHVVFTVDGQAQPPVPLNTDLQAAFTTSTLTVGAHQVTAQYTGGGSCGPSPSVALDQVVVPPAPHASRLTATPALAQLFPPHPYAGILTATLTDAVTNQPLPGQPITFTTGNHVLGTAFTDAQGRATLFATLWLALIVLGGGYTASYAGDATHQPATATAGLIS